MVQDYVRMQGHSSKTRTPRFSALRGGSHLEGGTQLIRNGSTETRPPHVLSTQGGSHLEVGEAGAVVEALHGGSAPDRAEHGGQVLDALALFLSEGARQLGLHHRLEPLLQNLRLPAQ